MPDIGPLLLAVLVKMAFGAIVIMVIYSPAWLAHKFLPEGRLKRILFTDLRPTAMREPQMVNDLRDLLPKSARQDAPSDDRRP